MMRTIGMSGLALALSATGLWLIQTSGAGEEKKKELTAKGFVKMASASDMAEIKTSKMAQEKASSETVKKFAAKMIADHTAASQELMTIAAKKGYEPAKDLNKKGKMMAEKLATLEGADFDAAYIEGQTKAHEDAVKLFTAAQSLDDEEIKAFAEKTLPVIQGHLKMIKAMAK